MEDEDLQADINRYLKDLLPNNSDLDSLIARGADVGVIEANKHMKMELDALFPDKLFDQASKHLCGEDRLLDIDYGLGNTNQKVIQIIEDFRAISTTISCPRRTTVVPKPAGPEEVGLHKQNKQTNKQTNKSQAVGKIQKGKMKAFPLPFGTKFRTQ